MCGEIEAESPLEERILSHFQDLVQRYRAAAQAGAPGASAHGYMDQLFAAVLERCARDLEAAGDSASLEQLRAQAIVLARLSGLLAGQLPAELDGLPATMDALLVGYRETDTREADYGHHHGHHHHH